MTVPLYDTLGPETIEFVVKQTDLTTVVCGGASELQKLVAISGTGLCPTLKVRARGGGEDGESPIVCFAYFFLCIFGRSRW